MLAHDYKADLLQVANETPATYRTAIEKYMIMFSINPAQLYLHFTVYSYMMEYCVNKSLLQPHLLPVRYLTAQTFMTNTYHGNC